MSNHPKPKSTPLSDVDVKKAKSKSKDYKLSDGHGLHLLVTSSGGKLWRLQYRFAGKQKMLSFGQYPAVSLADARRKRDEARRLLADNQDPSTVKKQQQRDESTFSKIACEWFCKRKPEWSGSHSKTVKDHLDRHILPVLGDMTVRDIRASDIRVLMLKLETRGITETARRVKTVCGQVFRYAVAHGLIEHDPSASLKTAELLSRKEVKHFAAATDPKELAPMLRAIDNYRGTFEVRSALKLLPLLLLRPVGLRELEWTEVDLESEQINIPARRMKTRQPHIVPLSRQAVAILKGLHPLTGHSKYVFKSPRFANKPIGNKTLVAALRYLGFTKEEATAHGFRATARTLLDEVLHFPVDIIEHQLAHTVKDTNGRAYNRTTFLQARREMMQQWSDYLDSLKAGARVIPLKQVA